MGTLGASHLTSSLQASSSQDKPSIFDILSQESLASSIKPALNQVAKVLALAKPEIFARVLRNYDEYYLAFDLLLQNYFLKNYGATFSENFYSMKRVHSPTDEPPKFGREKIASLVVTSLWPYFEAKLNKLYDRLKEAYGNQSWQNTKGVKAKFYKLFTSFWPYIKSSLSWISSLLKLAYVLNRSSTHSPYLWLLNVVLMKLTPQDLASFDHVPAHLQQTGVMNRMWRIFLGLPGYLSRFFAYGLFFVQFLNFMNSSELASQWTGLLGMSKVPPPPHKLIMDERDVMNLETNKCPICLKNRVNDTALFVSGYVFCYTCIHKYVKTYHKCPITDLPASSQHLIRLFV